MKKQALKEIRKIIVKVFTKFAIKIYNIAKLKVANNILAG